MGSKKTKAEPTAENEAMKHRLEALGQKAGNGGRGGTDHQRVAEDVGANDRVDINSASRGGVCLAMDVWSKFRAARKLGLLCLAILVLVPLRQAGAAEQHPIVFAGDSNYPPYEFLEDDKPTGASADLVKALGEALERPVELRLMKWSEAQKSVLDGTSDVLTIFGKNKKREMLYDFSESTFLVSFSLFVPSRALATFDVNRLSGQNIGVTKGGWPRSHLETAYPEANAVIIENSEDGFRRLIRGELDAVIANTWSGYLTLDRIGIASIRALPKKLKTVIARMAVTAGNKELLAEINKALAFVKATGKFDKIIDDWSGQEVVILKQQQLWISYALAIVVFIALTLLIGLLYLNRSKTIALARDITERKKVEEALRESEKTFRNVTDALPARISFVGPTERYRMVNKAYEDWSGKSREEIIGKTVRELIGEPAYQRSKEVIAKALAGESATFENWIPYKGGPDRLVEAIFLPNRDDQGSPDGFFGLTLDITERKRAEAELRASQQLLETVFNAIPHTMVIKDRESRYIQVNNAWYEFYGRSPKEVIGKAPKETAGKSDINSMLEEDQITLSGKESTYAFENTRINRFGEKRNFQMVRAKIRDGEGNVTGLVALGQDVSDRKQLEAQLQQSQKMEAVGTLAGGIAHNFNNLLQMIMSNVALLLMETDSSHPQHEILSAIKNRVKSGSELTRQLLGFARGGKYQVKPTDLNRMLAAVSRMFARTQKKIIVRRKYQRNLSTTNLDQGQIEQVLLNLFVNSQEAMPRGGELLLKSENVTLEESFSRLHGVTPGKYVKISVQDTGKGMDQETMGRIFEPFFTTKEMAHGSGLGLASAYGIIRNHAGIITVDSEVGKGTTFDIYLPATDKEITEIKEAAREVRKGTGTVLLVDDEEGNLTGVRMNLEMALGYKSLTAKSGAEAIKVYAKNKDEINLVILDLIMPGMGGGETFDKLRELNPKVKVLLSSGYSLEGEAAEVMERGCNGFIQKPFDPEELSEQIHKVLDQK